MKGNPFGSGGGKSDKPTGDKTPVAPSKFLGGKSGYFVKRDASLSTLGQQGKMLLSKDKSFKAPREANALSKQFDNYNGDFDTLAEFVCAYMRNDHRALRMLKLQNFQQLEDVLENMSSEIQDFMHDQMSDRDAVFKKYISQIEEKKIPHPFMSKPSPMDEK